MSYKGKTIVYMRGYVLRGNGNITLYYSDRTVETLTIESWIKAAKKK